MSMEGLAGIDTAEKRLNDIAMTGWQYSHDREMQRDQAEYNKQIAKDVNSHMANLQREARINGPSDLVAGMKMAGLNPALATGDSFASTSSGGASGVAAPSSPASRESTSMGKLALEAIRYQDSERGLMNAQSQKLKAEAESIQIDNKNKLGANFVSEQILRSELEHIQSSSPEYSSDFMWASALLKSKEFNSGHLLAFMDAMEAIPKLSEANYLQVANKLAQKYSEIKLFNLEGDSPQAKRTRDALASVDYEQARQIRETTDNIAANTMLLVAEMARTDKNVELIEKQKQYIDKQMELLGTQIRSTHHADLIAMYEDGEYVNTALGIAFQTAPGVVQGITTGGVFGLANRLANGAKRTSASKASDVPKNETVHEQWRYNKNGQPTSYKRTHMSGLAE